MSTQATTWAWGQDPRGDDGEPLIGPSDKLVLLAIADHAWPDGTHAFPSHLTIAKMTGLSERSVRRSVLRLVDVKLIERHVNAGGTKEWRDDRRPNLYTLPISTGAGRVATDGHPSDERVAKSGATGGQIRRDGWPPMATKPNKNPSNPCGELERGIALFAVTYAGSSHHDAEIEARKRFGDGDVVDRAMAALRETEAVA